MGTLPFCFSGWIVKEQTAEYQLTNWSSKGYLEKICGDAVL